MKSPILKKQDDVFLGIVKEYLVFLAWVTVLKKMV